MTIDPTVTSATLVAALVLVMQGFRWINERASKKEIKEDLAATVTSLKTEMSASAKLTQDNTIERAKLIEKEVVDAATKLTAAFTEHRASQKAVTDRIEASITDHKTRTEDSLGKVLAEVQKTNGRVTSLERAHEIDVALRAAFKEIPAAPAAGARKRKK